MTAKSSRTAWGLALSRADQDLWRQSANCTPAVAEWFWLTGRPGRGNRLSVDNRAAVALCRTCPVLGECLAYEVAHPDPHPRISAGRLWPEGRVL